MLKKASKEAVFQRYKIDKMLQILYKSLRNKKRLIAVYQDSGYYISTSGG